MNPNFNYAEYASQSGVEFQSFLGFVQYCHHAGMNIYDVRIFKYLVWKFKRMSKPKPKPKPKIIIHGEGACLFIREKTWRKDAPGIEYGGKRKINGMPDKRTALGKAWYSGTSR